MGSQQCCEEGNVGGFQTTLVKPVQPYKKPANLVTPMRFNETERSFRSNKQDSNFQSNSKVEDFMHKIAQPEKEESTYLENRYNEPAQNTSSGIMLLKNDSKVKDTSEQWKSNSKVSQPKKSSYVSVPPLLSPVKQTYQQHRFFQQVNPDSIDTREFSGHIYEGEIQHGYPEGFGKLYKKDGSLFIGQFQKGKANGKGVFIFKDGSFYQGNFIDDKGNDSHGLYSSETMRYEGGFKNNEFHGQGVQKVDKCTYSGHFEHGKKTHGKFQWKQDRQYFAYDGQFNEEELFHGHGELKEPSGEYVGQFFNGKKQGQGYYNFKSGIKYQGEYVDNQKNGVGKLINASGLIAFEGNFTNGLPNGVGYVHHKNGTKSKVNLVMGLDSSSVE